MKNRAKKILNRTLSYGKRIQNNLFWKNIPSAILLEERKLGVYGGRLFVEDLNNDGTKELLWLQSAGIFKSRIYDQFASLKEKLNITGRDFFCITVTNQMGDLIWQHGEPYQGRYAYLSHAEEHMVVFCDVNNDGYKEVLVLDGSDNLLILNPINGKLIKTIKLPADNFSILHFIKFGKLPKDFIILVGVTDQAYAPHSYGNPWLILNNQFEIVNSQDYLGAGHAVLVDDVNKDGLPELLIGYQLVDINGNVLWTLDVWEGKEIDSLQQHVDHVSAHWIEGEWFAAISGSDKQYYINSSGETLWCKSLPHPQHNLIGDYHGEKRIFVLNQRELMNSFNLNGKEFWRGVLPESWLYGKPKTVRPDRPIHMNIPMDFFPNELSERNDYILYKEGGWPYLIDFNGKVVRRFPSTKSILPTKPVVNFPRLNNIGLAYDAEIVDINNDEIQEVIIYNREYYWVFTI